MQEDGRFHDEVQAAVAVGLGLGDVVLALEERDIVLLQKGVGTNPTSPAVLWLAMNTSIA